jgi:hypothetical protein
LPSQSGHFRDKHVDCGWGAEMALKGRSIGRSIVSIFSFNYLILLINFAPLVSPADGRKHRRGPVQKCVFFAQQSVKNCPKAL